MSYEERLNDELKKHPRFTDLFKTAYEEASRYDKGSSINVSEDGKSITIKATGKTKGISVFDEGMLKVDLTIRTEGNFNGWLEVIHQKARKGQNGKDLKNEIQTRFYNQDGIEMSSILFNDYAEQLLNLNLDSLLDFHSVTFSPYSLPIKDSASRAKFIMDYRNESDLGVINHSEGIVVGTDRKNIKHCYYQAFPNERDLGSFVYETNKPIYSKDIEAAGLNMDEFRQIANTKYRDCVVENSNWPGAFTNTCKDINQHVLDITEKYEQGKKK